MESIGKIRSSLKKDMRYINNDLKMLNSNMSAVQNGTLGFTFKTTMYYTLLYATFHRYSSADMKEKLHSLMLMLKCYWCSSIATKIIDLGVYEEYLGCEKCTENIISYKARFCKTGQCDFPDIRLFNEEEALTKKLYHYAYRKRFNKIENQKISEAHRGNTCDICIKYLRGIRKGYETNFLKINFYDISNSCDCDCCRSDIDSD